MALPSWIKLNTGNNGYVSNSDGPKSKPLPSFIKLTPKRTQTTSNNNITIDPSKSPLSESNIFDSQPTLKPRFNRAEVDLENEIRRAEAKPKPLTKTIPLGKWGQTTKKVEDDKSEKTLPVGKAGLVKVKPREYDNADAVVSGALDSATLGILNAGLNKLTGSKGDMSEENHKGAYTGGKLLGYMLPVGAASKALKPVLKGIKNPLINRLLEGAIIGSGLTAAEDTANGKGLKQTAKDMGVNTVLGAVIDSSLYGAGKGIRALANKIKIGQLEKIPMESIIPKEDPLKAPTLKSGTYKIKNTQLENAVNNYNEAIDTIQNKFMHNKLTSEEVARIKPELGIDLDKLVANIEKYQKPNLKELTDNQFLKYSAGIKDTPPMKLQPPMIKPKETITLKGGLKLPIKPQETIKPLDNTKLPLEPKLVTKLQNNVLKMDFTKVENADELANHITSLESMIKTEQDPFKLKGMNLQLFAAKKQLELINTRGHIVSKTMEPPTTIKDKIEKFYINAVDNEYRLSQLKDHIEKTTGRKLTPEEDMYLQAINSKGSDMVSKSMLTENMINSKGEVIGKSLKGRLAGLNKGEYQDFEDYLINRHAIDRMKRGEKVFPDEWKMTPELSGNIVKNYEAKFPHFKDIAKEVGDYNNQLVKSWLVDTGIISKEALAAFQKKNPNYIPMHRLFEDMEKSNFRLAKKGFSNQTNPIKAATGSQRKIISPLESMIEHTDQYIKAAKRNKVMQSVIKAIHENPENMKAWGEVVPTNEGMNLDNILHSDGIEGVIQTLNKSFDKTDLTSGNIVSGLVNGKKVHVKINDKELLNALTNLTPKAQGVVLKSVGQVTRTMKLLTTGINPVFSLTRNVFRDIPVSYINSKSTNNPAKFSLDLIKAFGDVIGNSPNYKNFKAVGGGHSSSVASSRNLLAESKAAILPGSELPIKKKVAAAGNKFLLNPLEKLNDAVESAPRLAEFKRWEDKAKGLYEANDVTVNFNKAGNVTKEADAFVPYLNAAVQGIDKLARTFKDNPIQASAKAFTSITIPTIVLYAINHDNPNYQEVSSFTKDNNFLIPKKDGTFFKIPKPRELGVMFGSDVERGLQRWWLNDPKGFKDFSNTVLTNFTPPNPIKNNIFSPVLTNIPSNKDFAGRPIVPGDLQKLSKPLQYDSTTSEPAKLLGKKLNASPKQIDYLAKSYLGGVAEFGLPLLTKGGNLPNTLKQKVTVDPVYSNDLSSNFYDIKNKLDIRYSDSKHTGEKLSTDEEKLRSELNKAAKEISELRKEQKKILNSTLSPNEKVIKSRVIQIKINEVLKKYN